MATKYLTALAALGSVIGFFFIVAGNLVIVTELLRLIPDQGLLGLKLVVFGLTNILILNAVK